MSDQVKEFDVPEAYVLCLKLGRLLGHAPLTKFPDCWEMHLDEDWAFAFNGHRVPKPTTLKMVQIIEEAPKDEIGPTRGGLLSGDVADPFVESPAKSKVARLVPKTIPPLSIYVTWRGKDAAGISPMKAVFVDGDDIGVGEVTFIDLLRQAIATETLSKSDPSARLLDAKEVGEQEREQSGGLIVKG